MTISVQLHEGKSSVLDVTAATPKLAATKAGQSFFGKCVKGAQLVRQFDEYAVYELLAGNGKGEPCGVKMRVDFPQSQRNGMTDVVGKD